MREVEPSVQRRKLAAWLAPTKRKMQAINMEMNQVEVIRLAKHLFQQKQAIGHGVRRVAV
jgi:hypothetical protein